MGDKADAKTEPDRRFGSKPAAKAPANPQAPAAQVTPERAKVVAPTPEPVLVGAGGAPESLTPSGLARRTPKTRSADAHGGGGLNEGAGVIRRSAKRDPEKVRANLTKYHTGRQRARETSAAASP